MNYSDMVSTGAFIVAGISLTWQIFEHWTKRRQDAEPILKVYVKKKTKDIQIADSHMSKWLSGPNYVFFIENIGKIGITVLEVKIADTNIESVEGIYHAKNILGAHIPMQNLVSTNCRYIDDILGKSVLVTCKTDTGKTFSYNYTLGEAN